ncbi:MAG: hypothetical protein Q3983_02085 [Capnocytophaga sp.]|nr:hypothetical protein [Capnocytophaga sp.]
MEKKSSFLDIRNGSFFLIEGITIDKQTTFSSLREQFPNNNVWEVGTGYFWLYFYDCSFEGKLFSVSLCFKGEQLDSLCFEMNERYTSWDDWSETYELQTEKYYDQWLTIHIGKERSFSWGKIEAIYDRKGGRTAIWLNYKI